MGYCGRSAFHIRKALIVTDLSIGFLHRRRATAAGAFGSIIGLFSLIGQEKVRYEEIQRVF